jgi:predicted permease
MGNFLGDFLNVLRYSLRTLLRSPGYTSAALFSLGLGIGANTAIFTITNAVFLHSLPVADPERVLELYTVDHATRSSIANLGRSGISLPNVRDIHNQNEVFNSVAAFGQAGVTLTGFGKPSQLPAFAVTANYFDVLGIRPAAGRTFDPTNADLSGAAKPETVLSYGLAQRLFGSPQAAVGRAVSLNSVSWTVIGVAPPEFNGTFTVAPPEPLWLPLSMHAQYFSGPVERLLNERRFRFLNTFGRLKPGVTPQQALANLQTIAGRLETAYPKDNRGRSLEESSLAEAAVGIGNSPGQTLTATVSLTVAVGFVLLIACANLANLSLARAARRSREMGIRVALGAPRSRLVGQLLGEAAVLSFAGGILGIAIGWLGAQLLWASRPGFLTQSFIDLHPDTRVCLFTASLSALSCMLFGLAPVLRASVPDVSRLLNTGGRGNVQGGSRSRTRKLLVVGEIALALIALVGAGLFLRSMRSAQNTSLGFETNNLIVARFNLSALQMSPERGREFIRSIVAKVRTVPGVVSVSVADSAPLGVGLVLTAFHEGDPLDSRLGFLTPTPPVSPDYFQTIGVPLVEGRFFNEFDRVGATRVGIVSQAFARRMWPGQRAIGKRIYFATAPDLVEVVGVVKDHTILNIGETPQGVAWLPFDQAYQPVAVLHVRTAGPPESSIAAVLAAAQTLNSELALQNPGTVKQVIGQALWAPRMAAALFGILGLLGMTLAVIGVYGVMAYMVVQRTSEIGIRMAVGARPLAVIGMVLGQSMQLAAAGIAIGIAGALLLTRMVGNLLYDVSPNDPGTFATVATLLAVTALLAGGIPAWRASRIDPVRALRQE